MNSENQSLEKEIKERRDALALTFQSLEIQITELLALTEQALNPAGLSPLPSVLPRSDPLDQGDTTASPAL